MAIILYFAKVVKRFNGGFIKNFKNFKKYFFARQFFKQFPKGEGDFLRERPFFIRPRRLAAAFAPASSATFFAAICRASLHPPSPKAQKNGCRKCDSR